MAQPSFLVLMCDQFRADCIGALGNPHIRTPNLDRLARRALVFRRAYTASPVCVPARAALHYSRYPVTTGCVANHTPWPDEATPGFVGILADAGYRTHAVGKCHFLPDPAALRGFGSRETQEEVAKRPEDDDYLMYLRSRGHGHVIDPHGVRGEAYYLPQQAQMPAEDHPTRWVADRAIDFLRARGDEPFLLLASFIHPHPPLAVPAPWYRLYDPARLPAPHVPDAGPALVTVVNRLQMKRKFRDRGTDPWLMQVIRAYYYAAISFVDAEIGRVLETLEVSGAADDTVVVFLSDHGEYLGDFGCFGKRGMHDAAARVPLLVADPAHGAGDVAAPVSLVDIGPSILSRAGIAADGGFDGRDVWNGAAAGRGPVFAQFGPRAAGVFMVTDADGKYVFSSYERRAWLFDSGDDTVDRIDDPARSDDVARYRRLMAGYDPELDTTPGTGAPPPDEGFEALNADLGPITSLHPWVRLQFDRSAP